MVRGGHCIDEGGWGRGENGGEGEERKDEQGHQINTHPSFSLMNIARFAIKKCS